MSEAEFFTIESDAAAAAITVFLAIAGMAIRIQRSARAQAAFAGRAGFRDTGAPARAWLIGIGRRQLGTFTRKAAVDLKYRRRMRIQPVPVSNEDLERIEAVADFAPAAAAIRDALAQLTPTISEAVHLRVVNDLPFAEVARRLGCTEGAARVRVSRGLTQMADTLEEHR